MEQLLKNAYINNASELLKFFHSSFKNPADFKLGVEFEKLGVDSQTYQAITYSGKSGVSEFLKRLKLYHKYTETTENDNIIGLDGDIGHVTLEPGSQIEYSTKPFKSLKDIENANTEFNRVTGLIGKELGVTWLGLGIQPLSTFENINMIPKERYEIMKRYLPTRGDCGRIMMMETAGTQVSIDFDSEADAMRKLRIALALSPFLTAMFVNSPIRGGKLTGYKSFRANGWLNTDNDRCGLISEKIFQKNFEFADYVEILLDVLMFFIQKEGQLIDATGMTFRQYLKNGCNGHKATMDDWFLHMTTFFPDIRLKNFLEIRNCDCQRSDLAMALPAMIKGLMYNTGVLEQVEDIVKDLNWADVNELRNGAPKYGLDLRFKKFKISDIAKELVAVAEFSLDSQLESRGESIYLEKLKELVSEGKTPADIIISKWDKEWNRNIKNLVEYSQIL